MLWKGFRNSLVFKSIRSGFISIIEYFFPPRCLFCNALLNIGTPIYICGECADRIGYYNNNINSLKLPESIETYCDGMVCIGQYKDTLKISLKRFKFSNKPSYYRGFGKLLALKLQNSMQYERIDLMVSVPLHKSRQRRRGYNQSELIAKYAANQLGIPYKSNVLIKMTDSRSQSTLRREERLFNVQGLFKVVNAEAVNNKNILIIDDIITTGSTVNQCSKALKEAGARSVIAGAVATTREY